MARALLKNIGTARTADANPAQKAAGSEATQVTCRDHVDNALELSSRLLELANEPRESCDHDGCLVLDGVLLDCALEIRRTATLRRAELSGQPLVAPFGKNVNRNQPTTHTNSVESRQTRSGATSCEPKEEKR